MRTVHALALFVLALPSLETWGQARPVPPTTPPAQEVDVDKIRERYWAQGEESEMGVIQRRLYPRTSRIELGVTGGFLLGDPFLSTKVWGASLGYHFNELLSAHVLYVKANAQGSSAAEAAIAGGFTPNSNPLRSYWGLEGRLNFAHGKLATLGASMLYLDCYLLGGAGSWAHEAGNSLSFVGGVGHQLRLNSTFAVNLDYRLHVYQENPVGKSGATLGQPLGERTTVGHGVTLGLSVFLNFF